MQEKIIYCVRAEKDCHVIEKEFENYDDAFKFIRTYMAQGYFVQISHNKFPFYLAI